MLPLETWSTRSNTTLPMSTTDPPCRSGSPFLAASFYRAAGSPATGKYAIQTLNDEQDPTHHELPQHAEDHPPHLAQSNRPAVVVPVAHPHLNGVLREVRQLLADMVGDPAVSHMHYQFSRGKRTSNRMDAFSRIEAAVSKAGSSPCASAARDPRVTPRLPLKCTGPAGVPWTGCLVGYVPCSRRSTTGIEGPGLGAVGTTWKDGSPIGS